MTPTIELEPAAARELLLARAIEESDPEGRLVSEPEREQLELEAQAAAAGSAPHPEPRAYLQERARRLLAIARKRQPRLAALQEQVAFGGAIQWLLPLAACLVGAAIDRIDNPQQVNMLSPPLLGVILWNVAAYLLLAVTLVWGRGGDAALALQRWFERSRNRRTGRLHADVRLRYQLLWLQVAGRQQALWWKQVLHLTAAGWAVGLGLSIAIGGLVRQYRVGWESTLLDPGAVHAILSVLFAPVVALLPFQPFSPEDLQRMAFASGSPVGVEVARRWVGMYLALLALLVVLPRMALAFLAWGRRRAAAGHVTLDAADPYFAGLLARVTPLRLSLVLAVRDARLRGTVMRAFEQASGQAAPQDPGCSWRVLATGRGDALHVVERPAGWRPEPAADLQPAVPARWWQRWVRGPAGAAVPRLRTVPDAVELLLVDDEGMADAVQVPRGPQLENWLHDLAWLDALRDRVPAGRRAAFERISQLWLQRNRDRFAASMQALANWLRQAAADRQEVAAAPTGLRQIVDGAQREALQRAREAAQQDLLQRLRAGEAAAIAEVVRLHAGAAAALPLAVGESAGRQLQVQQQVSSQQAGLAGAASGAAMGAGIDLATGGLTLGAAAALGALVGGTAALAAALRRNRGSTSGASELQVGEDTLLLLAENALVSYLAVSLRCADAQALQDAMPRWRSEVVAAVARQQAKLQPLWEAARRAPQDRDAAEGIARELEAIARAVLSRL